MGVEELREQAGGAGLSRSELHGLLLQLFSRGGPLDTVFFVNYKSLLTDG